VPDGVHERLEKTCAPKMSKMQLSELASAQVFRPSASHNMLVRLLTIDQKFHLGGKLVVSWESIPENEKFPFCSCFDVSDAARMRKIDPVGLPHAR
jgi:hypothetical protein